MATDEVKVRLRVDLAAVTEREAVLRERAAFAAGFRVGRGGGAVLFLSPDEVAAKHYPLPKVTRPRVWVERGGMGFKVVDGALWFTCTTDPKYVNWKAVDPTGTDHEITSGRIRAWADLLANPTEEVEA